MKSSLTICHKIGIIFLALLAAAGVNAYVVRNQLHESNKIAHSLRALSRTTALISIIGKETSNLVSGRDVHRSALKVLSATVNKSLVAIREGGRPFPNLTAGQEKVCLSCHNSLSMLDLPNNDLEPWPHSVSIEPIKTAETTWKALYEPLMVEIDRRPGEPLITDLDLYLEERISGIIRHLNEAALLLEGYQDRITRNIHISAGVLIGMNLLILSVVGIFIRRSFQRPIEALVRAATSLMSGDLTARVKVWSGDELGRLSETFNRMAERLAERQESMELIYNAAARISGPFDRVCDRYVTIFQRQFKVSHLAVEIIERGRYKVVSMIADGQLIHEGDMLLSDSPFCDQVRKEKKTCQYRGPSQGPFPKDQFCKKHDLMSYI